MKEKKWIARFAYSALAFVLIFFLATHTANVEYDSPSYINFAPTRPPLYPLFIWLFHWTGHYQFEVIMWFQAFLLFAVLMYARNWLLKKLRISDLSIFLTCLFVILTISLHFQVWYVQSEGLTFPFFILAFFLLIECFQKYNIKKVAYLALLGNILVLTRLQFYYFYGIFILLCGWYFWQGVSVKSITTSAIILFGSMMLTFLIDHSYHYFKHGFGFFSGAPYGQLLIMGQTLYLADSNAADYFQNEKEKKYVRSMIQQRNIEGLNKDSTLVPSFRPSYLEYAYRSYSRNFVELQKIIANTLKINDTTINFESVSTARDINKIFVSREFKKNFLFIIWKFIKCVGGVPSFLFYLIFLIGLVVKIIKDKIRFPDLSLIFVAVTAILTFLNAAIIAICNPDLPPYFCYSQFMFYCVAAFLASRAFRKLNPHDII